MAPAINSILYSILCAAKIYEWDPYMLNLTPIGKVINKTMTITEKMTTELVYGQPMQTCVVKRFIALAESGHFFIYESSIPENKAQTLCKNSDAKMRYDVLHSTWCFSKH